MYYDHTASSNKKWVRALKITSVQHVARTDRKNKNFKAIRNTSHLYNHTNL
jgi:hypothetical protein